MPPINTDVLRDIVTRQSFLNTIAVINVVGGSTNAVSTIVPFTRTLVTNGYQVLHLLAMARAAEVELTIDDFQTVANKAPFLADLKYVNGETRKQIH